MLTFNVIDQRIIGVVDSTNFNVLYDTEVVNALKKAQAELLVIDNIDTYEAWVATVKVILASTETVNTITAACDDLMYDSRTGHYYVKVGAKVSKHPVPQKLVEVILESTEKGIDPTPIVKAWIRFLRNPNFSTRKAQLFANYITAVIADSDEIDRLIDEEGFIYDKAVERAKYCDVTITQEGLIVAKKYAHLLTKGWVIDEKTNEAVLEDLYKTTKTVDQFSGVVTESIAYPDFTEQLTFEPPVQGRSGDKFFCGDIEDHVIKVGEKHELASWSMVNTNDNTTCVKGLNMRAAA